MIDESCQHDRGVNRIHNKKQLQSITSTNTKQAHLTMRLKIRSIDSVTIMRPKEREDPAIQVQPLASQISEKAPETLVTERLVLRKPTIEDAKAIFQRYASDPKVCHYLGWKRNESIEDTKRFLMRSNQTWKTWPAGPYLIFANNELIGGIDFSFETPSRASCGYVIAKDAWGKGYATEALQKIRDLAPSLGIVRLYALVYPGNEGSIRVLEKCGFEFEGILRRNSIFPNINMNTPLDDACYSWIVQRSLSDDIETPSRA